MNATKNSPENTPETCRVHILPHGLTRTVPKNVRLSDVLHNFLAENEWFTPNTRWQTACGGRGTCKKCGVTVFFGDISGGATENGENGVFQLACQTRVTGDMTVLLPLEENSQGYADSTYILTWAEHENLKSSAAVHFPQDAQPAVAVDLGTTTLVLSVLKNGESAFTAARGNPLRRFGADVISRIQYASTHPGGTAEMQGVLLTALGRMLREACENAGVAPEEITKIVLAGNTVMEQIFLGLDVTPLGRFPFTPAADFQVENRAADACFGENLTAGWNLRAETEIALFPCISGFVGGDITAGIAASGFLKQAGCTLFMDVGTNGELVLFTPEKTLACATAAGPAFEGAQITHGMTAQPGAVEHVKIGENGEILELRTISDAPPRGICGSGLVDLTAELLRNGLLTPDGKLHTPDGRFYLTRNEKQSGNLSPNENLYISQADIRQIQLAAGAISTGIRILLERCGIGAKDLSGLWLAGGFGHHLRLENVRRIGLIPAAIPVEKIRFLGNTSLHGAKMAALSPHFRQETLRIPDHIPAVDLSQDTHFSDYFMESMIFPGED